MIEHALEGSGIVSSVQDPDGAQLDPVDADLKHVSRLGAVDVEGAGGGVVEVAVHVFEGAAFGKKGVAVAVQGVEDRGLARIHVCGGGVVPAQRSGKVVCGDVDHVIPPRPSSGLLQMRWEGRSRRLPRG